MSLISWTYKHLSLPFDSGDAYQMQKISFSLFPLIEIFFQINYLASLVRTDIRIFLGM